MRYYYDNPLKAAYMGKHFGIRVIHNGKSHEKRDYAITTLAMMGAQKTAKFANQLKFYINDAHYDLLKPLGTDLIEVFWLPEGSREAHFSYMTKNEADKVNKENEQMGLPFRWLFSKVILRGGEQWFTPKQSIDSHLPTQNINDFLKV